MAVTLDAAGLAEHLPETLEEAMRTAFAKRMLSFAPDFMLRQAPDAPEAMHNEATIRLSAYLADRQGVSVAIISDQGGLSGVGRLQDQFANAFRYSGAQSLLLPWTQHGAGIIGDDDEQPQSGEVIQPPKPTDRVVYRAAVSLDELLSIEEAQAGISSGRATFALPEWPAEENGYLFVGVGINQLDISHIRLARGRNSFNAYRPAPALDGAKWWRSIRKLSHFLAGKALEIEP